MRKLKTLFNRVGNLKQIRMIKVSLIFILLFGFSCISIAQTITIGSQVWMTKNLDVSTFRNGDQIPQAKTKEEWEKAGNNKKPAWCYYDNDPSNGEKYGKLYNWYAVRDSRGLAPKGFHIPTDDEWEILESFLGEVDGTKMKKKIGWGENYDGTNSSGFSALPGGYHRSGFGFYEVGFVGYWWSDTETTQNVAWYRRLSHNSPYSYSTYNGPKKDGFSVRCLRD
jgi:uncharacterized protein (TIGR02145 family)